MPSRILLVDDEPTLCELVARTLRNAGYVVVEACNGLAGWELFIGSESFDLVVTDSHMPDMSGLELVQRLRERNPTLPIVQLSGSHGSSVDGLPGDVRTLFKPLGLRDLVTTIQELLAA